MRPVFHILTIAMLLSIPSWISGQEPGSNQLQGSLSDSHVYKNPALSMTLTLPGEWQSLPKEIKSTLDANQKTSSCRGPLCGDPQIDVALITKRESLRSATSLRDVFLIAYKLSPPYLDRSRFPLKSFASAMLTGSLGGSGFVPAGDLASLSMDGKPAYRLLARKPDSAMEEIGYVSESNGYVFMLVCASNPPSGLPELQSAVEKMTIH